MARTLRLCVLTKCSMWRPQTGLGFFEPKTIVHCMRTNANVELDAGTKTFASGLLPDLIAALRRSRKGDLVAVIGDDPGVGPELEAWCRFTHNSLVDMAVEEGRTRWVLRYGEAPKQVGEDRPVGSRLWLYTNFDCNLSCDYCCVRSSPTAPRRALGIERVRRIAIEAAELDVSEIFVTGGEPFMLPDIGEILAACAAAAPITVLTNGMLFAGSRLETLRSLQRERVTFRLASTVRRRSATKAIVEKGHGHAPGKESGGPALKDSGCDWRRQCQLTRRPRSSAAFLTPITLARRTG
jgi:hypothetical protein